MVKQNLPSSPVFAGERKGGVYKMKNKNMFSRPKRGGFEEFLGILRIPKYALRSDISGYYRFCSDFSRVHISEIVRRYRREIRRYAKFLLSVFCSPLKIRGFEKKGRELYFNGVPVFRLNGAQCEVTVQWNNRYLIVTGVWR